MSKEQDPWPQPRYMMRGSPLVGGGKARLMSAKKVTPKPATPREVSEREEHGYTELPHLALDPLAESLDEEDWKTHVDERSKRDEVQRQKFEAASREQARRLMNFEERLVSAHVEARMRCIDVASEVRLVRHMQEKGKHVRHLESRLFTIERKVWRGLEDAA